MLKLINIEIIKVFKHKSIYIILFFAFIFCLLNNIIYKIDYNKEGFYKYGKKEKLEEYITKLEKINKRYDVTKESDISSYLNNITKIEIARIKKKYSSDNWQYIKAKDYLYDIIYEYYYHKEITKESINIDKAKKNYDQYLNNFKNNNWKYFIIEEKKDISNNIKNIEEEIDKTADKQIKDELKENLKNYKYDLKIINYRIKKNISYNNTYLNEALIQYRSVLPNKSSCKISKKATHNKKINCYNKLTNLNINKYIIENKININKPNTLNYQLRTIVDDYELFIVLIILISSSILISEEFSKGTIKQLLIKPYKRSEILLSKYLTCIIICILTIIILFLSHMIIGGIIFGFNSLKNGVVIYNFKLHNITKINIFIYMLLRIISKAPMFIILITVSFILGIILNSIVGSFSIVMLIYTFSELINKLAIDYNLKFLKYSITLNWNYQKYLFGAIAEYKYLDLKKSLLIFIIYDIILMSIMLISFSKKNIRNI